MNKYNLLSATAMACGLLVATPASAQLACDLNGVVQPAPAGETLVCGDAISDFGGTYRTLVGTNMVTYGNSTTQLGYWTVTSSANGFSFGFYPVLPATPGATAVGAFAYAVGNGSAAFGDQAGVGIFQVAGIGGGVSLISFGTAIGSHSTVAATNGTALGYNADVTVGAVSSVALGANSIADQANTISVGQVGAERRIVNVAEATGATDAVNLGQMQAADSSLQTQITQNSSDIATLQTNDAAQDTAIAQNSSDIATLQTNDLAQDGRLTSLETNDLAQDTAIANLQAGDAALQGNIDAEATTRAAADTTLQSNIAAEATARASADTTHTNDITTINNRLDGTSIAFGAGSTAGAQAVAIGDGATAGAQAVSIGKGNVATGVGAVAIGDPNTAIGQGAVALGNDNTATGEGAVALGDNNSAVGLGAVALGNNSIASSAGAVAIGNAALANGTSGVAVGNGASNATFANSVALGNGTINTAANQVSVGGRTIGGVANGVAATDAVNLGQLNAATAGFATNVAAINSSILGLQGDVATLFDMRKEDRKDMKQGIASAMALPTAPMPSTPGGVAYAVNGATFRGEYAAGASLTYRLNTASPTAINVGVAVGGNKNNGARIGISGEF